VAPARRAGFARPQGRARIETFGGAKAGADAQASPGLKAGRGLKLDLSYLSLYTPVASPGLKAGRGLKHRSAPSCSFSISASPGLKAGRGLKHVGKTSPPKAVDGIARPQGRARIETRGMPAGGV